MTNVLYPSQKILSTDLPQIFRTRKIFINFNKKHKKPPFFAGIEKGRANGAAFFPYYYSILYVYRSIFAEPTSFSSSSNCSALSEGSLST